MKKGYILTIIMLVLINIVISLVLIKLKNNLSELQFLYFNLKEVLEIEKTNTKVSLDYLSINNNKLTKLDVTDINNQKYQIEDILSDKKETLVLRFHESTCSSCIEKYLTRMNTCIDNASNKNIIILASYSDAKNYNEKFSAFGIRTYFCDIELFEFDKRKQAFLFTIDSKTISRNAFIPNDLYLDDYENYLTQVLSKIN